ncbi:MAG: adenylate/guanylate cyclase domain-containing protein [Planctomycetaceae bacterium]
MLRIQIENDRQSESFEVGPGYTVLLGRRVDDSEGVKAVRLIDEFCSRLQMRLSQENDGRLLIENLSSRVPLLLDSGRTVTPQGRLSIKTPLEMTVGATRLHVDVEVSGGLSGTIMLDEHLQGDRLRIVGRDPRSATRYLRIRREATGTFNVDNLIEWFEALVSVQRSAAGSAGFYREIADAMVQLMGLDYGVVLLRENGDWKLQAVSGVREDQAEYSSTIVQQVCEQVRTFYEPLDDLGAVQSLMSLTAVVASPILATDDSVLGVLYGARLFDATRAVGGSTDLNKIGISEVEAQLVQLLAASAATGLARAKKESEAARLQVQFEDFCSAEIVRELQNNPRVLEASEREITVLFCDVRGFTRLSERLDPKLTYEIMSGVMDGVVESVMSSSGVIIDFYGDGAAAMWNAPLDQPNHHRLALECAGRIQQRLCELNRKWASKVDVTLRIGIGIHTGKALVGNVGGTRRVKYGPRGSTVNLTSRIEGLTKQLGADVLLSGQTMDRFDIPRPPARRLGRFQVAGLECPVELFECFAPDSVIHSERNIRLFEDAVKQFECGRLDVAADILNELTASLPKGATDGPAKFLLTEIARRKEAPPTEHTQFIRLSTK